MVIYIYMIGKLGSQSFVYVYKISMCPPCTAGRYCNQIFTFSHTFESIERGTLGISDLIFSVRWSLYSIGVKNTSAFIWPQRKKSHGVRSGDRAGKLIGPPLPIQLFGL